MFSVLKGSDGYGFKKENDLIKFYIKRNNKETEVTELTAKMFNECIDFFNDVDLYGAKISCER